MAKITALYADENGEIFFASGMAGAARIGNKIVRMTEDMLIPLPNSADLMFLPERRAVGYDKKGNPTTLPGRAVSAILPAGYTRLFLPAFKKEKDASILPLFGYTAVALRKGNLYAAALYTDKNDKWDPMKYNTHALKRLVRDLKKIFPDNRLVTHLGNCSLEWHCCTAQNLFYHRWEAGIPVSPVCNANCLGCISLQPAECCPSPQSRITFHPSIEEITELAFYHLSEAPDAIVSFGQGCEGEPSLAADVIAESIKAIRAKTGRGQININTNAGYTEGIKKIVDSGLDTMRVSIISARKESYNAYYRSSYSLDNVKASIHYALQHDVYVSLNLLYYPGFNDCQEEFAAWMDFFHELPVQMIQIRNLNIDPDAFLAVMPQMHGKILGPKTFFQSLRDSFPKMVIGNFSHFVKKLH